MKSDDEIAVKAPAALPRACQRGEHYAGPDIVTDAAGAEHARCRGCGCKLTRMSFQRRWFRTGLMG